MTQSLIDDFTKTLEGLENDIKSQMEKDIQRLEDVKDNFKDMIKNLASTIMKRSYLISFDSILDCDDDSGRPIMNTTIKVSFNDDVLYFQDVKFFLKNDRVQVTLVDAEGDNYKIKNPTQPEQRALEEICSDLTDVMADHYKKVYVIRKRFGHV